MKRFPRSGRKAGRDASRSTLQRPVYHTYLSGRWTLYITDIIPRSAHRQFLDIFDAAIQDGGNHHVDIYGTTWGKLVVSVYAHSHTAYCETEAQFEYMLKHGKDRPN